MSEQMIDNRFLATRQDKLHPPKKFLNLVGVGGYEHAEFSSAM